MSHAPSLILHMLPPSHPCATVKAALRLKGLEFEQVVFPLDETRMEKMEAIYGEGNYRVPGLLVDGEPVHGSNPILEKLEELRPEPSIYPADRAEAVREAAAWGDGELQDLGRRLPWGALHFRPEMLGLLSGAGQLEPPAVDFAIRMVRGAWKYHRITAERLYEDLQAFPGLLDRVDALVEDGVIGQDEPTAADFQIGATMRVFSMIGDLDPLLADRPAGEFWAKWFGPLPARLPSGAYPAGWVPTR
jgi:glutathione S-transferase